MVQNGSSSKKRTAPNPKDEESGYQWALKQICDEYQNQLMLDEIGPALATASQNMNAQALQQSRFWPPMVIPVASLAADKKVLELNNLLDAAKVDNEQNAAALQKELHDLEEKESQRQQQEEAKAKAEAEAAAAEKVQREELKLRIEHEARAQAWKEQQIEMQARLSQADSLLADCRQEMERQRNVAEVERRQWQSQLARS